MNEKSIVPVDEENVARLVGDRIASLENRSKTAFEDISVEPDGNMANYRQVIGEKIRLKGEVHSWFLRSFSRGERGALVTI